MAHDLLAPRVRLSCGAALRNTVRAMTSRLPMLGGHFTTRSIDSYPLYLSLITLVAILVLLDSKDERNANLARQHFSQNCRRRTVV